MRLLLVDGICICKNMDVKLLEIHYFMSSIIILLCKVSNVLAFCGMSVGVVFHCINILTMTLVWSFQWIVFSTPLIIIIILGGNQSFRLVLVMIL